ncbi:MAG: hypothetical protein HY934_05985 [Candidatus Firestonebacteria bacterium]|nr:hypothetical protein [Candidatus Firestonebacteria bacterium]
MFKYKPIIKLVISSLMLISLFVKKNFASDLIYYKNILDREDKIFELDMDKGKKRGIPSIDNFLKRSNVVENKLIFAKFDNIKKGYAFYIYNLVNGTKRFLFMFLDDKKITNIYFSPEIDYVFFSSANFLDKPNIIKVYKFSLKTDEMSLIFKYEKKGAFHNIDYLTLLQNDNILIKFYQEDIKTQIYIKSVDIKSGKVKDLISINSDYLKVFSLSSNKHFLVYHPNNGMEKSVELGLVHIYNFKENKDFTLVNKKSKKSSLTIIGQFIWSKDSKNLIYTEAKGYYDDVSRDFVLEEDNQIKSISITGKSIPEVVLNSPINYNIVDVWKEYNNSYLCLVYNKSKNEWELVLLNKNGNIEKELEKGRLIRVY